MPIRLRVGDNTDEMRKKCQTGCMQPKNQKFHGSIALCSEEITSNVWSVSWPSAATEDAIRNMFLEYCPRN